MIFLRHSSLAAVLLVSLASASCNEQAKPEAGSQRISLAEARQGQAQEEPLPPPDTSQAFWTVDESGQAIRFGNQGAPPLLTLDCRLGEEPPQLAVIRHAEALPGQGALFPVIGNGMRSRFLADATLRRGEWRWEAVVPADDPQLDVFTGTGELQATLPGKGLLEIAPSRIPGEFIEWCRAGGRMLAVEEAEVQAAQANPAAPAP